MTTTDRDLGALRHSLARHQQEKAELEQQVHALQEEYLSEVAPLEEEVLRIQKERLKQAAQAYMRSARLRNAYHDARRAYETFQERRASATSSDVEMKATYRRASKKCHPDAVPDSYREEAAATFQALESAYEANHRSAVRAIAEALDQWGFPEQPFAPAVDSAEADARRLRRAVSSLESSIERLRASEAYQALRQEADIESVMAARKQDLLRTLQKMKRRRRPSR